MGGGFATATPRLRCRGEEDLVCVLCDLRKCAGDAALDLLSRSGAAALYSCLSGQKTNGVRLMDFVYRRYGREGMYGVAALWCDSILRWMPGYRPGTAVYLYWEHAETGKALHAGEVPDEERWAGQMIAARAAGDGAASRGLFEALPDDEAVLAGYMAALLNAVVAQVSGGMSCG